MNAGAAIGPATLRALSFMTLCLLRLVEKRNVLASKANEKPLWAFTNRKIEVDGYNRMRVSRRHKR